jgi:hypothetical protein
MKEFKIRVDLENGESFWFPVTTSDEKEAIQIGERIVKSAYISAI